MKTHDTMIKILELRELEKELSESCQDNCQNCHDVIRERINNLIQIIGNDVIENPHFLKNRDFLLRIQELNALEGMICGLCKGICGECKSELKKRLQNLCELLERDCNNCPCDS